MEQQFSRIVVAGSVAFDHILQLPGRFSDFILPDRLDRLNVSFTVETMRVEFGGTGGNCAYTLGLLGQGVVLVSSWGKDAEAYSEHLENVGVDLSGVMTDPNVYTATGHVMTDVDGNQMWMFYPGALKRCGEIMIREIAKETDFLVLMPSQPDSFAKHLHEAVEYRKSFMFDPAFLIPNLNSEDLDLGIEHAKIIVGNDYEIGLMERKTDTRLSDWLRGEKIVIKTMGSHGSYIWHKDEVWEIPAAKLAQEGDPTGAGDTYRSGFLAGFVKNLPLQVCGRMGSLAAVYCAEKPGTQTHGFTMDEFKARYKENFGEDLGI